MMLSAREIAEVLGGACREGHDWRCICPVHGGRSLALCDGDSTLLVKCWSGCDTADVLAQLRRLGLLDAPVRQSDSKSDLQIADPQTADFQTDSANNNRRTALEIWEQSTDPRDTPVEAYLKNRGLQLPSAGGDVLRFNSLCPFGSGYSPCMVALVRNIKTNRPQAIHRTAITYRGQKQKVGGISKMSLGPIAGGAIKLSGYDAITDTLGVGEGIESALSLQLLKGCPVWSLICAAGIENFPLLPGIDVLAVAVDHDDAGERATVTVAERWHGRRVAIFEPVEVGVDLNDLLRRTPA